MKLMDAKFELAEDSLYFRRELIDFHAISLASLSLT
jgi:hypothetical protein